MGDLSLLNFFHQGRRDLLALPDDGFPALGRNSVGQLKADQTVVDDPEQLLVINLNFVDAIERAQNLLSVLVRARENTEP